MAIQVLRIFLVSLLAASGARIRQNSAMQVSSMPEDWVKDAPYVCMQKWKEGSSSFENKFCLVKHSFGSATRENVRYAEDVTACAKTETMKVCELKGEGNAMRLSYTSKKYVAKSCFRAIFNSKALVAAAVDASSCEEMEGGEIGEALIPPTTTTATTTTTTTEEVLPEPEINEEAEKAKVVDALSLFSEEGFWHLHVDTFAGVSTQDLLRQYGSKFMKAGINRRVVKKIKCCVSSAGRATKLQDLNAEELPSARMMGDKTGCGHMFGDTYHNGLEPFGPRTETTCDASVAEIMEASGLDLEAVLDLKLPEVIAPDSSAALLQVASTAVP